VLGRVLLRAKSVINDDEESGGLRREERNFFVANGRSQHLTGALSRVELLPDTYLRRPSPDMEFMAVKMLAA
jgi:hypothetical protein